VDDLKKQAKELGIKVDGRWSEERLQEEVNEALAAKAAADAEIQAEIEERDRVQAEQEEAEQARLAKEAQDRADAEALAEIEAREKAEKEAYEAALAEKDDEDSVVIINLQANPMKVLGLTSYGEATLTAAQLADPRFYAKVERAKTLGLIKVK
jgi:hypothetical protein